MISFLLAAALVACPDVSAAVLPDGGAALPAAICQGQPAPVDGVFLTVDAAARLAAERAELRAENKQLQSDLEVANTKPQPIPGWVWLVSCIGGVVVTGIATHYIAK